MLALTLQRRNEVSGMRWSELNLAEATWTLPASRTKNANEHIVPMPSDAMAILEAMKAGKFANSDFVFTTTGRSPVSGFAKLKKQLDKLIAAENGDHAISPAVAADFRAWRLYAEARGSFQKIALACPREHAAHGRQEAVRMHGMLVRDIVQKRVHVLPVNAIDPAALPCRKHIAVQDALGFLPSALTRVLLRIAFHEESRQLFEGLGNTRDAGRTPCSLLFSGGVIAPLAILPMASRAHLRAISSVNCG